MGNSNSSRAAADLQRLAQRFAAWRQRRELGTRIPEPLWRAAVMLACQQGVGRTALALSLSYHALKQRVESGAAIPSRTALKRRVESHTAREPQMSSGKRKSPSRPTFVELPAAARDDALAALPFAALRVVSHDVASLGGAGQDASRGCLIEWTGATGGTLRIQLAGCGVSEIAALCRELGSGA